MGVARGQVNPILVELFRRSVVDTLSRGVQRGAMGGLCQEALLLAVKQLDERNIADDLTDPALGDAFDMLHEETSALGKRKLGLHEKGSDRFSIEQQASKIPTNNVIGTVQSRSGGTSQASSEWETMKLLGYQEQVPWNNW